MQTEAFARRERDGIPFYVCHALEALPGVRHGFSARVGGAGAPGLLNLGSVSWDAEERVAENRRRYVSAIGAAEARLAILSQIHSDRIHIIDNNAGRWNGETAGDAMITTAPGVALAVQAADCFPILVADPEARAVAAAHAGWRGTLARILAKTIAGMRESCGSKASSLLVAVGPGIRPCCCEVGQEVAASYDREFPGAGLAVPEAGREGKYLLDLPAALRLQALEGGVDPARIFDLGLCTRCMPEEFFSFRREGPRSGRMMGVIARLHQSAGAEDLRGLGGGASAPP